MTNTPPTVYLDTSAWNALCDWASTKSQKWTEGPEYLCSSANLDEFSLASPSRAKELAAYAWRISNRRKLLDHIELTVAEVASYQKGVSLDPFDGCDPGFQLAWRAMRGPGITVEMRAAMKAHMDFIKSFYRDWFKLAKSTFGPTFAAFDGLGVSKSWEELLTELYDGDEMRSMLRESLEQEGLLSRLPSPQTLDIVPWDTLPCTSCWMQYHVAMYYLASFESGRIAKPDKGDQVDYRHACYAGFCDVFVTRDNRMHEILSTMVPASRARIMTSKAFHAALQSGSL